MQWSHYSQQAWALLSGVLRVLRERPIRTRLAGHPIAHIWILQLLALSACAHDSAFQAARPAGTVAVRRVTKDLAEPAGRALQLAKQDGPSAVLVVFDIDDTLLTMPQYLGSDAWFEWQSDLLSVPQQGDAIARDFAGLVDRQISLFQLSTMTLTQPNAPALVEQLQGADIAVLAVTARSPQARGSTLRELDRHSIDFSSFPDCGPPLCPRRGRISAQQIDIALRSASLSLDGRPREISIAQGVMMLAGQNKAIMLKLLLESTAGLSFTHILVIDDTPDNLDTYAAAAGSLNAALHLYEYRGAKQRDGNPADTNQERTISQRRSEQLEAAICGSMASHWCRQPN
ncbi:MAG: DUF2608 domain-containing protein [Pseudomonadota bacterium]